MAKILVVDDNPLNRKLLVAQLSADGHLTLEASDGLDGLRTASAERPQLVISDIMMPSMDGYEFVHELRLDPGICDIPVIFHTAQYHEREALKLAETCRVARVLVKPCSPADLLTAVDQALAGVPESRAQGVPRSFDRAHLLLLTNKVSERADALAASSARMAALTELIVEIAVEQNSHALLEKLCAGARNLLGARFAIIAVTEEAAPGGVFFATCGIDFGSVEPPPPSIAAGPFGALIAQKIPWRAFEPRAPHAAAGLPAAYPTARAYLAVPLHTPTEVYGWVCLGDKLGANGFDAEDEELLAVLGSLVGRSYESSRLYLENQRLRAELRGHAERSRRAAD